MIEWTALWLTLKLAAITTVFLFLIGLPLAYFLAFKSRTFKPLWETFVALPIVLPPTVLGFYLLLFLGPNGGLGSWWMQWTGQPLTFSFTGLVIASVIYSLPFVVQPIQSAFESVEAGLIESARTLGAKPMDAFGSVIMPLSRRGLLTAAVMGFAHTLGEFGVVLMVGGNIPEETRVVSIAIYDHVEMLQYGQAHALSLVLLALAFVMIFCMYYFNRAKS